MAVALPAVVALLAILLAAVTVGVSQLRIEEAARAGAREIMRGESTGGVQAAVLRIAGEDAQLEVLGDGAWSTVQVTTAVRTPVLSLLNLELSATAAARSELTGSAVNQSVEEGPGPP
ncbi:TadE family type IV pilus minor pilin [Arthrobacter sp. H5]|uniref:TadE family type IV pilus minor pilin n=1 Tax=Arthrobacter sp. H5 TaxID=1267973 RepID=UPI0004B6ECAA|nr:TadE family type IV pilus minor pilin [Arthrobacter sp. H5]